MTANNAQSNTISLEELRPAEIAEEMKKHASQAKNESELRIRIETLLDPIRKKLGIEWASYEHRHKISGHRKDALYGTVVIEYKSPGRLENKSVFRKGKEQLKRYITEEAEEPKRYGSYFGVLLDGYAISFLRFRKSEWEEQDEPLEVNARTVVRLLEALRGLQRKPIDAELLLVDFGPKSELSKKVILAFYDALKKPKSTRTKMLFEDWRRVFSQVCDYSPAKLSALIKYYGLERQKGLDVEKLMFAIHTYYTTLMKFLTSEIVTLFADSFIGSYLKRLEEAHYKGIDELHAELQELEEGGLFLALGIRNFLEADYFAWYLDEWSKKMAEVVIDIIKRLLDYEPATVELDPDRVKDLFKRLYQNLIPKKVRHDLGEYFTPDWLAELLLNEVSYEGKPSKRLLDPACGSGTFLVLAIKRMKEHAEEHFLDKRGLLRIIVNSVVGIDLNPLAVLASRANYIIGLGELIRYRPKDGFEIPVYLADSILVSRKMKVTGELEVYMTTKEGKFWVPHEVIDKRILSSILALMENCAKNEYSVKEFGTLLGRDFETLTQDSTDSLLRLYKKILKLERQGKNRIWTRLLKNSFAPLMIGKFDYVVGNPPWINWEHLPDLYREGTKKLWDYYGLLEKTKGLGLGKVKRDMAMLFTARCLDRYSKETGKFSFLIPFTAYKTQAGAGFRKFLAKGIMKSSQNVVKCKVVKVHDLVELYPFEGATNRTSLIVLSKLGETAFPIPCTMWSNPRTKGIDQEAELVDVCDTTRQFDMILTPLEIKNPMHPWMIVSEKSYLSVAKITGHSLYKSHEGSNTALSGTYWVNILSKEPGGILIQNSVVIGKKKVKKVKAIIESDLIYRLVRGREVRKWYSSPSSYIVVPHDDNTGKPITESMMKAKYDKTYSYFLRFKDDLEKRSIHKLLGKGKPFYTIYDFGSYSFSPYKVVWKDITGKVSGKQEIIASVISPTKDQFLGIKKPIIDNTLLGIHVRSSNEAHYLCSILNSLPARAFVLSYTHLHVRPYVIARLNLMGYDGSNRLHGRLSELSKEAHKFSKKYYEKNDESAYKQMRRTEKQIDATVAKLYGIADKELREIENTVKILSKGEE